jgi:hypothetical protein
MNALNAVVNKRRVIVNQQHGNQSRLATGSSTEGSCWNVSAGVAESRHIFHAIPIAIGTQSKATNTKDIGRFLSLAPLREISAFNGQRHQKAVFSPTPLSFISL